MLIAAEPLTGWGYGKSGYSYCEWMQDPDQHTVYTSLVNSAITTAAEHGLPVLSLLIAAYCIPIVSSFDRRSYSGLSDGQAVASISCAGSLVAWAACNMFTTLMSAAMLWIIPGLSAILWLRLSTGCTKWFRISVSSLLLSLTVITCMLIVGTQLRKNSAQSVSLAGTHVRIENNIGTSSQTKEYVWHVWSDDLVLGKFGGKELRRLMSSLVGPAIFYVNNNGVISSPWPGEKRRVIILGRHAELLHDQQFELSRVESLWIIHPLELPPGDLRDRPSRLFVILPSLDETGLNGAWRRWGRNNAAHVSTHSSPVGVDIRPVWPLAPLVHDIEHSRPLSAPVL